MALKEVAYLKIRKPDWYTHQNNNVLGSSANLQLQLMGIGGAAGRQQPHGAAICHQLTNQHIVLDRCTSQSGQKAKEEVPRSARLKKTNASTKPDTLWLQIGTVMLIISHRQDVLKLLECWGQPSNTSASASPQGSNGRAHHEVACSIWVILATTDYCTLAHLFGITRSTVCSIVHVFACSISEAIKLPEGMKWSFTHWSHWRKSYPHRCTERTSRFLVFQFQSFGPSAGGWRSWILVSLATILK